MPRIFADSILARNAQEAISKIDASVNFTENEKVNAKRIIKKLIASRSRSHAGNEEAEARVDYIADHLGIDKKEVIHIVNLLREERLLADAKDLSAYIKKKDNVNHSLNILNSFRKIEGFLLNVFTEEEKTFHIKELNEQAEEFGCTDITPNKLKTIINFWAINKWIKRRVKPPNHLVTLCLYTNEVLQKSLKNAMK